MGRARGRASREADQTSFTSSDPRLAGGKPRSRMRDAELPVRLGVESRRMGSPGHSLWRCTGPRLPDHHWERARAVSKSPAESAAEVAGPSRRSEPRRDFPSLPVCRSPTHSSLTPGCDILRPQLHGLSEPSAEAERCEADACREWQLSGDGNIKFAYKSHRCF